MSESHAVAGWAPDAPSPDQLKELFAQIGSGRITKSRLQAWLTGADMGFLQLTNPEVILPMPALKRPTLKELQAEFPGITSIERDDSPEGEVALRLGTILVGNESVIGGSVYEERLIPLRSQQLALGFQHRKWMLEHQQESPALMALLGKCYIDFSGIVVVKDGDRNIPYAGQGGKRWSGYWNWVSNDFNRNGRVAVSGKSQ